MAKNIYKRKHMALGKTDRINIAGYKHLLPLYRKEIDKINESENKRMFEQLAAREGAFCIDEFIERMNKDAEFRSEILRKYKIE